MIFRSKLLSWRTIAIGCKVAGTAEIVEKVNGGNRTVPTLVFSDGSAMTNPPAREVVEKLASL